MRNGRRSPDQWVESPPPASFRVKKTKQTKVKWLKLLNFIATKGTSTNDIPRFLAIFDLPTYFVLLYEIQNFWAILDPPTYPNIGCHLWTFPIMEISQVWYECNETSRTKSRYNLNNRTKTYKHNRLQNQMHKIHQMLHL